MSDILGTGAVANLGTTILELIGRFIPDRNQAAQFAQELERMQSTERAAQMEVNKAEAASTSVFVAGWRPAIGWVCAAGMSYQFLIVPLVPWVVNACGGHVPPMPGLDDNLWQLVLGMLGLGGLRTFEKIQGVASVTAPSARR